MIKSKIPIIEFYYKWAAIVVTMAIGIMKSVKRLVNKKIVYIPTKVNKILGKKDIASQRIIDEYFYINVLHFSNQNFLHK